MKWLALILALLAGCATKPAAVSARRVNPSPVSAEAAVIAAPGQLVAVSWRPWATNAAAVWWADRLPADWQVAAVVTNTNQITFYSTNQAAYFKVKDL